MKQKVFQNRYNLWYMLCFTLLGLIDQRRGSAVGEIQMIFSNLTGIVIAMLLLPSLDFQKFKKKVYLWWTPICLILTALGIFLGEKLWLYRGQWNTAVLNLTVWSYLVIYIFKEWKNQDIQRQIKQPFYWAIYIFMILMVLSVHEKSLTLWYLMIYSGFYIIGVPKLRRKDFLLGMLDGIILWFFIQQTIAFAFRPYDFVRYRGLYSGETQNSLFYMLVFCAFLVKWLWGKQEKQNKWLVFFYYLMAVGNVGFLILTGSRSGLLGAVLVTIVLLTGYDIYEKKSFYKWILHGVGLILCSVLMLPIVYSSVRYLPTILHHPIWYEGEYDEENSVRSFDPWNSSRYISMEEMVNHNLGRILNTVGIKLNSTSLQSMLGGMVVYAEEVQEPGSTPNNPYKLDNIDINAIDQNSMWIRIAIYSYYWKHLNLQGHIGRGQGFYINSEVFLGHAHNMFLQIAYDYGIPAGILFCMIWICGIIRAVKMRIPEGWVCISYLIAISCFGILEMVVTPGQITLPLMWIIFYFVGMNENANPPVMLGRIV